MYYFVKLKACSIYESFLRKIQNCKHTFFFAVCGLVYAFRTYITSDKIPLAIENLCKGVIKEKATIEVTCFLFTRPFTNQQPLPFTRVFARTHHLRLLGSANPNLYAPNYIYKGKSV